MRKFIFSLTMLATFLLGASTVEAQNYHPSAGFPTDYFYIDYPVVQDHNTQNVYLDVFPIDVCNDIPRPVDLPYGETEAPKFCISGCEELGLKPNIRLAVREDGEFVVEYRISFSTTNASGSFSSIDNGELSIYDCFKPNVTGPCVVEYTIPYALLQQNGAGYYRIEAQGISWGGPSLSHTEYYEFPDLNSKFSVAGNWSSYDTPNNNPINVCSDNLTIDIASDMKSFVHFFENLPYGPQITHSKIIVYDIYSADANGNIVPGFHLTLGYDDLAPSNFDLNTATGGYFANNGGYYLIKSSITYSPSSVPIYKPCNNPAEDSWILLNITTPNTIFEYNTTSGYIPIPQGSTLQNPLIFCGNVASPRYKIGWNTTESIISKYDIELKRYDLTTLQLDMIVLPFNALDSFPANENLATQSVNDDIYDHYGPQGNQYYIGLGLMNIDYIYEMSIKYKDVCGTKIFNFFFTPTANCKTEALNGVSKILQGEIYPNPFKNEITIFLENDIVNSIKVVDLLGKTIYEKRNIGQRKFKIDWKANEMANGVYFLEINDTILQKIVKK